MPLDETFLSAMRERPLPVQLAAMDDAILAGVYERNQMGRVSRAAVGACAAMALVIGLAGGTFVSSVATAGGRQSPLTSVSALAPSHLLDDF